MKGSLLTINFKKLGLSAAAAALALLLAADLMQVTRVSGVSAMACTPLLIRKKPDAHDFVMRYREAIAREAARQDLPAELLAAVIVNHQAYITSFRRFTDCFGSAFGANLSLGLAQMRLSTAAGLDGARYDRLSAAEYRGLRARLLEPEQNIAYEAKEFRALLEQKNRFPGMSAQSLIHDPFAMALIITEYRMGRLGTPVDGSRLSANAFGALQRIENGSVDRFGRDPRDTLLIQAEIRRYLQQIFCDSGMFDTSVCEEWKSYLAPK